TLVRFGVTFVADPDRAQVKQSSAAADDLVAAPGPTRHVLRHPLSPLGQTPAAFAPAVEFHSFLTLSDFGIVAVLLASARIDPGGEQVPAFVRAVPRVGIGRRQRDPVEPVDLVAVGDALAGRIEIGPAMRHLLAGDAWTAVVDVFESGPVRCHGPQQRPRAACGSSSEWPFPRAQFRAGAPRCPTSTPRPKSGTT